MTKIEHKCGECEEPLRIFGDVDEEDWEPDPDGDGDRAFREYPPCPICGAVNKAVYTLNDVIVVGQPREGWDDPVIPTFLEKVREEMKREL